MPFRHTPFPRQRSAQLSDLSPSIHWAQQHKRSPSFQWKRRIYDFEILYIQQGDIRAQLGGAEYVIPAGNLFYIPSGVHHAIQVVTEPDASFLGIHFDFFDDLEINREEDIIVNEGALNPECFCHEPIFPQGELFPVKPYQVPHPEIITLMENVIQEFTRQKTGYELVCKGLLLQILALILRGENVEAQQRHPKYSALVLQLMAHMEQNYHEQWPSGRISQYLNVHPDYAAKIFKDIAGVSPSHYLQSIRHQAAKKFLRETEWKMSHIASFIGYEDVHYFSRIFRMREGMTARDYRKLAQMI